MLEEFYYFDTNALSATVHFRHGAAHRSHLRTVTWQPRCRGGSLDLLRFGEVVGRPSDDYVAP